MPNLEAVQQDAGYAGTIKDHPIKNERGEPYLAQDGKTPATMGIVGGDSKIYRDNAEAFGRWVASLPEAEQAKVDWRAGLAACAVARWSGWWKGDATNPDLPCTTVEVAPWLSLGHILYQVEEFARTHKSFFVTPSPG